MDEYLINNFKPENWNNLSVSEKYVLVDNCVASICEMLELPKIDVSFMENHDNAYGSYCAYTESIFVDSRLFDLNELSGYNTLSTIFHECRHYEQNKTKMYDLSIGISDRNLYFLDMSEYDAHFYEFFADNRISEIINDERFDNIYQDHLASFFANFCNTLSNLGIIGPVDYDIYKNLFIQKFINDEDKIYSDNFLTAYDYFTDIDKFHSLYKAFLEDYRNELTEQYKALIEQKAKFEIGGPAITQKFVIGAYNIVLQQKENSLKLEIEDLYNIDMPSFQLLIKDTDAMCCLEFSGKISSSINLDEMQEIAKAVIKQYEMFNDCKIDNVRIGDSFAGEPVRKLSREFTNSIDFSTVKDLLKLYDDKYLNIQKTFYTAVLNEYNRTEQNTPIQEQSDYLKTIFYELATEQRNIEFCK